MLFAMSKSLSGIASKQYLIDVTANNIANVNTTAFKQRRASFGELSYDSLRERGGPVIDDRPVQSGRGVNIAAVSPLLTQGSLSKTADRAHLAVAGSGFMRVVNEDGRYLYTRAGDFQFDAGGNLVTARGERLEPRLDMVERGINPQTMMICVNGEVRGLNAEGEQVALGRINLYRFTNSAALLPAGGGLYEHSTAAGALIEGAPGEDGFGKLRQGFIERSNVDLSEMMVDLLKARRSLQANVRALTTAQELWALTLYRPN